MKKIQVSDISKYIDYIFLKLYIMWLQKRYINVDAGDTLVVCCGKDGYHLTKFPSEMETININTDTLEHLRCCEGLTNDEKIINLMEK